MKIKADGLVIMWFRSRLASPANFFGHVTAADVAFAVQTSGRIAVDKRKVTLSQAIKTAGKNNATVKVHPGVTVKVEFEVSAR